MAKKLEVKNLRISFKTANGKVQAVRDISFDLNEGETLAVVGESGSGKSVTSKSILGILAGNAIVEGGEIIYDGRDLLKISEEEFCHIRGDKIVAEAREKAEGIVRQGELEAEMEKKKAQESIKREITEVSAALTEQLLSREMNQDDHRKMIDSFLQGIGDAQ